MEIDAREELRAQALVWKHSVAVVDSLVLKCAVELGVADIIQGHGEPMNLSELGASLPVPCTNIDILRRIMNYLVHMQIFTIEKRESGVFYGTTSASKFLEKGNKTSMASWVGALLKPCLLESWDGLGSCLQGKASMSAFERVHQESLWEYTSSHPEYNEFFNEAMASHSRLATSAMIDGCGDMFREIGSLVDIGGGTGTAIRTISMAFPHIKCTLFDLPHVVENSLNFPGLNCVAGDMFSFIPNADAVLLTWVLHDWDDEDCIKILKNCKKGIPNEGGKVIIVDIVMDIEEEDQELAKLVHSRYAFDMVMMSVTGGKERTQYEWETLLSTAGFSHCKITPIMALQSVIVASP